MEKNGLQIHEFREALEFEGWLSDHFTDRVGIFVKFAKKNTAVTTIIYPQAVEVALCFGWIDSLTYRVDDTYFMVKFSARRPKGKWSKKNKDTVERLIEEKRMRDSGMREIENAKSDGRWDAEYSH